MNSTAMGSGPKKPWDSLKCDKIENFTFLFYISSFCVAKCHSKLKRAISGHLHVIVETIFFELKCGILHKKSFLTACFKRFTLLIHSFYSARSKQITQVVQINSAPVVYRGLNTEKSQGMWGDPVHITPITSCISKLGLIDTWLLSWQR